MGYTDRAKRNVYTPSFIKEGVEVVFGGSRMDLLLSALEGLDEFDQLLAAMDNGRCPAAVSGLAAVHRAHFGAAIHRKTDRPVVLVCADESEADRLARDLAALTGQMVPVLTARAFTFHNAATVSRQWEHRRLSLLRALGGGEVKLLVATVESLMQRTMSPGTLEQVCRTLEVGQVYDLNALAEELSAAGYSRCEQVEGVGQFALRGGILDVFSPEMTQPVRAEFFGDDLDAMGYFDPVSQRRTENVDRVRLLPAAELLPQLAPGGLAGLLGQMDKLISGAEKRGEQELLTTLRADREAVAAGRTLSALDRYLALICPDNTTAADFLPPDACVLFSESSRVAERARTYQWQLEEDTKTLMERGELAGSCADLALTFDQLNRRLEDWPVAYLDSFTLSTYPVPPRTLLSVMAKQLPSFGASLETAVGDLQQYRTGGFCALVLVGTRQRAENLQTLLREQSVTAALEFAPEHLPKPGEILITVGGLSGGVEYPDLRLAVLTEGQGTPVKRGTKKAATNRRKLESFTDLSPGDLVVHEHHGVGSFEGMVKIPADGVEKDYVKIAYAGTDVLYVPATQLDMVSKYIGGGEEQEHKKLSKLGGTDWEKAKTRTRKAVADLAKGLIQLYAQRQRQPGYSFSPDSPWQKEFEDQFEYVETEDQLRCVQEIKSDMERPMPMDRLLCGDVGYGKTEVAFRAIMKCVLDGKQAAILAPTTVLARQHYLTALKRFSRYPVNIDVVSRFRTPGQMKDTLRRVEEGRVDVLIGTHRLFNRDVRFKDLGLLVVDEEQRFGVTHKEHIKAMSRGVDVLTLSATPIPRTLNMALSGIRDMSTLEEPPEDRLPVQTFVMEHDWGVLADAIRRELQRGGQVYYLHNRVEDIERTAGKLRELLDDVSIAVAHGKMDKNMLSSVMESVSSGETQVLVCTTIIETGIDIPNVNTLIIEDADKLGLAQLHQIRGRVGRSTRRASAYLTFRRDKVLTEIAEKRLNAIRDFAQFGSGFKIAMRDLEIRGAGNLLGAEQSGHMIDVGYDMYMKLLNEAVLEARGIEVPQRAECSADLAVAANIPEKYIPSSEQRMDIYRRIALIRSEEEADDLTDELIDRFGDTPPGVNALIHVALLRGEAGRAGICDISQKQGRLRFMLTNFDMEKVSELYARDKYKGILRVEAGSKPCISLKIKNKARVIDEARSFVADWSN